MNEQDKAQMAEYGITSTIKMVYFYKEYRYDRLADALSYAKSDTKRTEKDVKSVTPA